MNHEYLPPSITVITFDPDPSVLCGATSITDDRDVWNSPARPSDGEE